MMMCVCSHPFLLVLLLFLTGGGGGLSIRVDPSLFQLALDTPAPAEPTPTQASRHSQLCEGQPCLNGGSCLALPSSHNQENTFEYTCSCSRGFTGRNCEFITDPCSSSPCLHGNCSRTDIVEDMEPSYVCECAKGYKGERCDQLFPNLRAAKLELANPSPPEPETPATFSTSATTQPIPIASTTPPPPPTLQPWQPKPGQKLQVVPWETGKVAEHLHCEGHLCELTSGTLTLSLEVPEETAVNQLSAGWFLLVSLVLLKVSSC